MLKTVIDTLKLTGVDIVGEINKGLQTVLGGVDSALPISLKIGTVTAHASATPTSAEGGSEIVDGLALLVDLGPGGVITVPITAGTAPNSNLLIGAPEDLVNGIVDGLEETLKASLNQAFGVLAPVIDDLQTQLLAPVFAQLEKQLLPAVASALEPIVSGTVNRQIPVSPTATGELDVTALHLQVLSADNTLDLARVHVGPNAGPAADDNDAQSDDTQSDDTQSDDTQSDDTQSDDTQSDDTQSDDAQSDASDADSAADADSDADADVTRTLPDTGAPNLLPLWIMGAAFVLFGGAILLNEKRRKLLS